MTICKNCAATLTGDYCAQCGQKDIELERPFFQLFAEAVREAFDVDGRAVQTLWTLLRHPGVLTSEFLAGRRRLYTQPVRLYLFISVVFFVLTAWVAGKGILLGEGQTLEADAAGQARLFADYVPQLMFVLLPVFALLLKVAYRQTLYFQHLIHALHLHSAAYLVLALMLPLEQLAAQNIPAMLLQLTLFAYLLGSFVISTRRVYGSSWLIASGKAIAILIAYMALVAGSFEAASFFLVPETDSLPFLTD